MTWALVGAVGVAVCGWTVAAGLYLQCKDALRWGKEQRDEATEQRELVATWRDIAVAAWGDVVRERHVAEFAVRQLPHPAPSTGTLRAVDDA